MAPLVRFLLPTRYKLIFLVEWTLYSILAILQSRFVVAPIIANLLWPMVFFYLVGCGMVTASRSRRSPKPTRQLLWMALLLAMTDQLLKVAVVTALNVGDSIPIVLNRLHLVHTLNMTGSWVAATMGSGPVIIPVLIFSVVFLALTPLMYRFYSVNHRQSFWSEASFVFLTAGLSSAVVDLAIRGFTVDYFEIPGHFAADLKDIFLCIFVGSFLVEAVDNPGITFGWKGWRQEFGDITGLASRFIRFARDDLLRFWRKS